jgi:starvation-inducible DNA-binding protein
MAALTRPCARHPETSLPRLAYGNAPDGSLVRHLQRQVANAFMLYGNYKHYHWQTYGPLFRDLHLLFDELARETLASIDRLVARIHTISEHSPRHLIEAVELSDVPLAAAHATMRDMVEEADRNVFVVVKELREAARIADEYDDQGTAALASHVARMYEQHKWCLRDILTKREGPHLV